MRLALKKNDIVYEQIKRDILSGKLSPGQKLLRGVELAKQLKVSHVTLRSAMKRLSAENLVTEIHGKGTFITNNSFKERKTKNFLFLFENAARNGQLESPVTYILPSCEKQCEKLVIGTNSLCIEFLDLALQDSVLMKLRQCDYDGVVYMGCNLEDNKEKIGKLLLELGLPIIIPHAHETDKKVFPQFATIQPDYKQAWSDGIMHLQQQGHTRIAFLCSAHDDGIYNLRGFEYADFLDFLEENGIDSDPELIAGIRCYSNDIDYDNISIEIKRLMSLPLPPTAIMCFSDFFALHVYKTLDELNIKIPDQVAVMGYCGYPGDEILSPSLSTVDFEYSKIGKLAVKILSRSEEWFHVDGVDVPHIISPHKVVSRESTVVKKNENKIFNINTPCEIEL